MSVQERKQRERAERERLTWPRPNSPSSKAGTRSPPAGSPERIEYSQPVLYSHFRGKREIIGAVALEGAAEMAVAVRAATSEERGPRRRPRLPPT